MFSLGAVLYTMLTGHHWAWAGDVRRSVEAGSDMPPALKQLLLTAVDPEPRGRFSAVSEMTASLAAHLDANWSGRTW